MPCLNRLSFCFQLSRYYFKMATAGKSAPRVQNGGFWNTQTASYSPSTQKLMKGTKLVDAVVDVFIAVFSNNNRFIQIHNNNN